MDSILTSPVPERYNQARGIKKNEVKPPTARHRYVLELHLAGYKVRDRQNSDGSITPGIITLTGYKEPTIYKILSSPEVNHLRQQIMNHADKEFEAQYMKVVDAVDTCLDPKKPDEIKLRAAELWGKFFKKFGNKQDGGNTINLTAEDIVFNIMNGNIESDGNDGTYKTGKTLI